MRDDLISIGVAALVGVAVVLTVKRAAASAVSGIGDTLSGIWQSALDLPAEAVDAVFDGVKEVRQTVADSSPLNPGYQLPPGWYRVKTRFGEVVTQYPDSFKTINPFDTLGLIDP